VYEYSVAMIGAEQVIFGRYKPFTGSGAGHAGSWIGVLYLDLGK